MEAVFQSDILAKPNTSLSLHVANTAMLRIIFFLNLYRKQKYDKDVNSRYVL